MSYFIHKPIAYLFKATDLNKPYPEFFQYKYVHDNSYNLLQHFSSDGMNQSIRQLPPLGSNRSMVNNPETGHICHFDRYGNRLQTPTLRPTTWTPTNRLQTVKRETNKNGQCLLECYVYAGNQRTRKITETRDPSGEVVKIEEVSYFGSIEKHISIIFPNRLNCDQVIKEKNNVTEVQSMKSDLRILAGHRQIAKLSTSERTLSTQSLEFKLSNHIDSEQLALTLTGSIQSYQGYEPYGSTTYQYGQFQSENYQYSGEEKDQTALHYYGARYYESENLLSWLSPDPAGYPDGHLNRYTMVRGNPVTMRDIGGAMSKENIILILHHWTKTSHIRKALTWQLAVLIISYCRTSSKNRILGVGEDHKHPEPTEDFFYYHALNQAKQNPHNVFIEVGMHASSILTYCLLREWNLFESQMFKKAAYGGQKLSKSFVKHQSMVQLIISKIPPWYERSSVMVCLRLKEIYKNCLIQGNYKLDKESYTSYSAMIFERLQLTSSRQIRREYRLRGDFIFLTNDLEGAILKVLDLNERYKIKGFTIPLKKFASRDEGKLGLAFIGKDHLSWNVDVNKTTAEKMVGSLYHKGINTCQLIHRGIISRGVIHQRHRQQENLSSESYGNNLQLVYKPKTSNL